MHLSIPQWAFFLLLNFIANKYLFKSQSLLFYYQYLRSFIPFPVLKKGFIIFPLNNNIFYSSLLSNCSCVFKISQTDFNQLIEIGFTLKLLFSQKSLSKSIVFSLKPTLNHRILPSTSIKFFKKKKTSSFCSGPN